MGTRQSCYPKGIIKNELLPVCNLGFSEKMKCQCVSKCTALFFSEQGKLLGIQKSYFLGCWNCNFTFGILSDRINISVISQVWIYFNNIYFRIYRSHYFLQKAFIMYSYTWNVYKIRKYRFKLEFASLILLLLIGVLQNCLELETHVTFQDVCI